MSKTFRAGVLAAIVSSCTALPSAAQAGSAFEGLHLGISAGPQFGSVETSGSIDKTDLGISGFSAGASGGYAFGIAPGWLLDIAGSFDWNDAKADLTGMSVKQGIGFGGDVSIGYMVDRGWLGYAKAGYESTAFHVGGSPDKRVGGILVGGGLRKALAENWSVRAEYNYVMYPSFTDETSGLTMKATTSTLKIGLDYTFNYRFW